MLNSRIKKYLILLLLIFCFIRVDAKVKEVTDYVNDYAHVLRDEMNKYISKRSLALDNASKIQVIVMTIATTDNMSIEEYANRVYNDTGIGSESRGVLILLCPNERVIRIEVGDGLGGILPDGKVGRILDTYVIPALKKNDWNQGIKNAYDAIYKVIVEEYNLNLEYTYPEELYDIDKVSITEETYYRMIGAIFGFLLGLIINFMVFGNSVSKRIICFAIYTIIIGAMYTMSVTHKIPSIAYFFSSTNIVLYIMTLIASLSKFSGPYRGGFNSSRSSFGGFRGGSSFGGHGGHSSGGGASRRF